MRIPRRINVGESVYHIEFGWVDAEECCPTCHRVLPQPVQYKATLRYISAIILDEYGAWVRLDADTEKVAIGDIRTSRRAAAREAARRSRERNKALGFKKRCPK